MMNFILENSLEYTIYDEGNHDKHLFKSTFSSDN